MIIALVVSAGHEQAQAQTIPRFNGFDLVDKTGNIRKPDKYRGAIGGARNICLSRSERRPAALHLRIARNRGIVPRDGKVRDGTVLVKEIFGTEHARMTTGDAHWASGTEVWFVMIKDAKGLYPGNPLWGDGW